METRQGPLGPITGPVTLADLDGFDSLLDQMAAKGTGPGAWVSVDPQSLREIVALAREALAPR